MFFTHKLTGISYLCMFATNGSPHTLINNLVTKNKNKKMPFYYTVYLTESCLKYTRIFIDRMRRKNPHQNPHQNSIERDLELNIEIT